MKIERIVLTIRSTKLTKPFENRWQRYESWNKLLVEVVADGVRGYGECSAMPTPYYNYENVETAWWMIRSYLAPLVIGQETSAREVGRLWEHIHGHEEAKATVECALWDCEARLAGRPLYEHLGGSARPVSVAFTSGIETTPEQVAAAVEDVQRRGYKRVRVKIRPGWDVAPLTAIRARCPDFPIIGDANGGYDASDIDALCELDRFGMLAIEQPLPAHQRIAMARLQARLRTAIALDESVTSVHDVEEAIDRGSCRIVNIKIGRVGGLTNALRILDLCRSAGIGTFVGAKYDYGIGRWTNIHFATLPGVTLPSDCGPGDRYFVNDPTAPPVQFTTPGYVMPRDAPGIGAQLIPGDTLSEIEIDASNAVADDLGLAVRTVAGR